MIKSSVVKAKIEPYKQIAQNHVCLELKIPTAKTLKVFTETDDAINLVKFSSVDEMFKNLEA